ncbi:thioesterase [Trametes versicolor FP-101664 SS1]|uniref:thioesterase n=1 Tax=Trametes versicolor (strain FP-101664) TaxID=717944 RepID=UPI0004621B65|nr:thioesterase [Trametes versicolor FP-101664 SS1]EIW53766.1 thioesterase [Trametes versicolor FP-101664 SS1]
MSDSDPKALRGRERKLYPFFLSYRTRWIDNDQYSHVNNSIYYHLFDSVVNTYLIQHAHLDPSRSRLIGLVVSSYCHFFSPVSFPVILDLGLRVIKLGSSSVTYEVAVFEEGSHVPSAIGGYTHVFVDRHTRKSSPVDSDTKLGLEKLLLLNSKL